MYIIADYDRKHIMHTAMSHAVAYTHTKGGGGVECSDPSPLVFFLLHV